MFRCATLALALLSALSGCAGAPKVPLVEHQPGDGPNTKPVPYDATYVLWSIDETRVESTALERNLIERDFQVGFIRAADGGLVAYAGGGKYPLSEGHYIWQIAPDAQKTRGDSRQADVGPVIATTAEAVIWVGAFVTALGGKLLYAVAQGGIH